MARTVAGALQNFRNRLEERFSQNCMPVTETGCWLWTGTPGGHGYGAFYIHGKDGCKTPLCVNPEHLEQVTPKYNYEQSNSLPQINKRKTHCNKGHPLSGENLYLHQGKRSCRTCRAATDKKFAPFRTTAASRRAKS